MDANELKKFTDEFQEAWAHVKTMHEDTRSISDELKATREQVNSWVEKLDGVDKDSLVKVQGRLDELETKLNRPMAERHGGGEEKLDKNMESLWSHHFKAMRLDNTQENREAATKAFSKFLRVGKEHMSQDEIKLLSTQDNEAGGFLVVPEYANEIIKDIADISEFRPIARVRQSRAGSFQIPKRTGRVQGGRVGEAETASESNSTYGLETIPNAKYFVYTRITHEDLQDSAFNMEREIRDDAGEEFAFMEGQDFADGSGVNRPQGIWTHPDLVEVKSGDANDITYTGLVRVSHGTSDASVGAFNRNYHRNARFLFNMVSLGQVRLLEDTANQLIFMPPTAGAPATILGFPYTIIPAAPNPAAGAYPVVFGDVRAGYTIVDRLGIEMLRNPYTEDTSGIVRFTLYRRTGGQVVLPEALRKMKNEAD